jgi:hypothetical protein
MLWMIAAFTGGFFVGAFVFYVIGAAKGYACAVRHLAAIGKAVLENAAASQVKPQPQATAPSTTARFN